VDEIEKLVREFDEAELHADTGRLRALLTEDFRSIGERGHVLDKQQWIARFADFRYLHVEAAEVEVRRYDGSAIVRCVHRSHAVWQGQEMTLTTRMSQVWVWLADGWRLAGVQFSSYDPEP
jgi:hypothetical protein